MNPVIYYLFEYIKQVGSLTKPFPIVSLRTGYFCTSNLQTALYSSDEGYCVYLQISQAIEEIISVRTPFAIWHFSIHCWVFLKIVVY